MILVVGATGQLGTAVVRSLAAEGQQVRAFVRSTANSQHLRIPNVQLAFGDLRDAQSVYAACDGADVIIATANTVAPRKRYSFAQDEGVGYRNLIASAEKQVAHHKGARQIIFMSVPVTAHDDTIPTFRYKREIEEMLMRSKIPHTIFRASLFMDDWFALIGSSIPLRGSEAATLRRPFWFSRAFMGAAGTMIEKRGIALVPGDGNTRHSFITLEDVASFLVKAVNRPDAMNKIFDIGGPEPLSWDEVVALFGKVLGRKVRALHVPAGVFRAQQMLLSRFSPAAGNLMGMNWLVGTTDTAFDTRALVPKFGITLTSGEEFLREKLDLPA
jgi:uncharacterized protein YbjT (DUF2867 family)